MDLRLTIIGSNAAIPAHKRGLSAQVLHNTSVSYLIDCGEGTQFGLAENKIRVCRIDQIFISHLHGDHIFGLFGVLSSASMQNRTKKMTIFAPPGLRSMIRTFEESQSMFLTFDLDIVDLDAKVHKKIFQDEYFSVYTIPLKHRVPATGFKFVERQKLMNIRKEAIGRFDLSVEQIKMLKSGMDIVLDDGITVSSKEVCYQKDHPKSFAYISDTIFDTGIVQHIKGVDVLFHESTYLSDVEELARSRMHSTARQAATIAKMAGAGKLILGHFSSRYNDLQVLLDEARTVFPQSFLGEDGTTFEV